MTDRTEEPQEVMVPAYGGASPAETYPEYCDDPDCQHLTARHNGEGCEDCTGVERCGLTPQDIRENARCRYCYGDPDDAPCPFCSGAEIKFLQELWASTTSAAHIAKPEKADTDSVAPSHTVVKACGFKDKYGLTCGMPDGTFVHGYLIRQHNGVHEPDSFCHPYQDTEEGEN